MATFPAKTNYAAGNVLTAAQMVDIGDQINALNKGAGRNVILNSDFSIWQRGTSFTTSGTYSADRWLWDWAGTGTTTVSRQTFTPGNAPVAGYESQYFWQIALGTGAYYMSVSQKIEDVRTFAGQTVTLSFWAKATSSITFLPFFRQSFGSGGSADVDTIGSSFTLTSSWTRYSRTVTLPSISGKTIGTSSYLQPIFVGNSGTFASNTVQIWGVQLEAGNTATAFQTATGTLAGEFQACCRYFQILDGTKNWGWGAAGSTTIVGRYFIPTPFLRTGTIPSITLTGTPQVYDGVTQTNITSIDSIGIVSSGGVHVNLNVASGLTQYRPYTLYANNGTVNISAEL